MKKILFIIFFAGFLLASFSPAIGAETDLKTVRVGVYDNAPKIYKDEKGEIKGFWADITDYIAQKENWNLIYVFGTWDEGLARLGKGEIDFMVDVAVSEERKQKYDFNKQTALMSWSIIYTRKDFDIKSFKDLEGKDIAVMKSSVHYNAPLGLKNVLTSFGVNANIVDVKSMEDVFKLLDANEANAGVVNWNFGTSNEDRYKVNRTGIIFNPSELNYAFPKNGAKNSYLISLIDFHLKELKDNPDSLYYKSIRQNFSGSLGEVEVQVLPKWLNIFLIVVASLLAIIIAVFLLMRQYQKTLRKEIDARVRDIKESEEKYSVVVNNAQDGVVIIQDKIVKFANEAVARMGGYLIKEVVDEPFIKFINPEEQKMFVEIYEKTILGQKIPIFQGRLIRKNGSMLDVEISCNVVNYANKPATVSIIRDISEAKKAELRLKEIDALKSKFIQVVSHQLRTPLNIIRWNLESLLSGEGDHLKETQKQLVRGGLDADVTVISRISDLLTAIDIEEGRESHLNRAPASLTSLLDSVHLEFKKRCAVKEFEIDCLYKKQKEPLPMVAVDASKIRIVLEKLIDNAINYTPAKGKISVSLKQIGNKIRFEITDTGVGIPKDEQKNITQRFFRASNASVMVTDASGLGLFIADYFVKQHGGMLGFESVEGQGSTFWFELPTI